jgi:hypothetical protein
MGMIEMAAKRGAEQIYFHAFLMAVTSRRAVPSPPSSCSTPCLPDWARVVSPP